MIRERKVMRKRMLKCVGVVLAAALAFFAWDGIRSTARRVISSCCARDAKVGGLSCLKVFSLGSAGSIEKRGEDAKTLLHPCLHYGRSFINTRADWNSVLQP